MPISSYSGGTMKATDNVIDFTKKLRERDKKQSTKVEQKSAASITDITGLRQEIIQDERRIVKRTILTEFIGANVIIPGHGLLKVAISDISQGGLAFDMETESGHFSEGESVAMRVYMNHKTYFPFVVKVTHIVAVESEGIFRVGAKFEQDTANKLALHHFVNFIETVSANLKNDDGDVMVSNIK